MLTAATDEVASGGGMVHKRFRRILVVRFRFMGDVILATPVLQQLRRRFPESYIAFLTDAPCHEVIEGHPAVDEVIVFKRSGDEKLPVLRRLARYLKTLLEIRRQRFDLLLNLHPHGERSALVTLLCGAECRVGYSRGDLWNRWYDVKVPYRPDGRYRVEHLLDPLRALGIDVQVELPSVAIGEAERRYAEKFLLRGAGPLVVMHPGREITRRAWPEDRYAALADRLAQAYQARVVFIGIASERDRVQRIVGAMNSRSESLVGEVTVKELAAIMSRAVLFVGMDSAPMHLASAVGLASVTLYGFHEPSGWKPPGDRHVAIHRPLPEHPCKPPDCCEPGTSPCMLNISVAEVFQAASRLLGAPPRARAAG